MKLGCWKIPLCVVADTNTKNGRKRQQDNKPGHLYQDKESEDPNWNEHKYISLYL